MPKLKGDGEGKFHKDLERKKMKNEMYMSKFMIIISILQGAVVDESAWL